MNKTVSWALISGIIEPAIIMWPLFMARAIAPTLAVIITSYDNVTGDVDKCYDELVMAGHDKRLFIDYVDWSGELDCL